MVSQSRVDACIDAALVDRFKAGDESAFEEIAARYRHKIVMIALGLLKNHSDAEEIAQDTLVRVYRKLKDFRGDSSLATWIYRIALNLSRNRYWYFWRRKRHSTLSIDQPINPGGESEATFAELMSSEESVCGAVESDEFSAILAVSMTKLDAGQREILTLRCILHRSYEEISVALGIKKGTVKSRISRARGYLKAMLNEAYHDQADLARI
jgi:RNA polymerase sigma-70 factor (ECF subfamily)